MSVMRKGQNKRQLAKTAKTAKATGVALVVNNSSTAGTSSRTKRQTRSTTKASNLSLRGVGAKGSRGPSWSSKSPTSKGPSFRGPSRVSDVHVSRLVGRSRAPPRRPALAARKMSGQQTFEQQVFAQGAAQGTAPVSSVRLFHHSALPPWTAHLDLFTVGALVCIVVLIIIVASLKAQVGRVEDKMQALLVAMSI